MSSQPLSPADYAHRRAIPTRWKDNDVYGHVNNVVYYSFFDTAINAWLIREGGLDIHGGGVIGVCAESHCSYSAAIAFPDAVEVGLRAGHGEEPLRPRPGPAGAAAGGTAGAH